MARGRLFNVYFLWTINLPGSVSLLCPSDRRNVLGHSAADTAAADRYGDTLVVLAPLLHSGKFYTEAPHISFLFQKLPQTDPKIQLLVCREVVFKQFLSPVMSFLKCK